jgi:uncharacterized membrane protein (DUF485 family)
MSDARLERIRRNPRFEQLCQSRSQLAWTLSAIMLIVYVGFILLVAFGGNFLATPLVAGGVTTIGIVIGVGVILIAIMLTAIYVWKANTTFDDLTRGLLEETQ